MRCAIVKRHLTTLFVLLGFLSVVIGFRLHVRWNGIVAWGLALIFLIIAAFCIKYIPEKDHTNECGERK
jgi:dolichyl-phosphate-mannose--protein O-mannosyl transferase